MKKFSLMLLSGALGFSGCISISTYEQAMKKCRDKSDQYEQLKAQSAALEAKNAELEHTLSEQQEEHQVLKNEISNVRNTYDELVQELKDNIAKGEVSVQETEKGLTVTMGNQILFASGKAELQPKGKQVLTQVAGIIKKATDRLIQVEGHTDNQPIASVLKARFPSNWDLSSARSSSVVRFLQDSGIDPALLVLTAYAENRPIADNVTPQGRQQNRRVEITLIPKK
jgi:chemotaxis protein MotB